MKAKLIILAAAAAAVLYSCSNDRDEEVRQEEIEKVKASNQEKFKLNKSGIESRDGEPETASDTIKVRGLNSALSDDPDTNIDPIDGGDPTTITPPKR